MEPSRQINKSLFVGIVCALPFFILNALVASGAPVVAALRSSYLAGNEQLLILVLLSLVLIGGLVSLYPVIKNRRFLLFNTVVGILFIGFSLMAGYGLGVDFYHCDILKIPNCD